MSRCPQVPPSGESRKLQATLSNEAPNLSPDMGSENSDFYNKGSYKAQSRGWEEAACCLPHFLGGAKGCSDNGTLEFSSRFKMCTNTFYPMGSNHACPILF